MPPKKATHQLTKRHNRDLVLKTIFTNETISRAEIARMTMLTRTTVSDVVAGLLSEGLVKEVGLGESIGGKPSILLSLEADSRYLIGLNLAQNKFVGAVVNLRGEIKETAEVPVTDEDGDKALKLVYQILDKLVKKNWKPLVGIGVGTPGLINTREGIVVSAVNLDWRDLPLGQLLQERYGLPVSVLNDSQATAIGEFVYGEHGSEGNLVVVNLSRGIGAGILINGRLFQGDGGGAGEIGHVTLQENGLLCRCGRRGCLETVASTQAVLTRAQALSNAAEFPNHDAIETKFFADDPIARQSVLEAGHYLGTSLGSLVGTLNIKKIVLTGDMTCFGQPWLDAVQQTMAKSALGRMAQETELEIGKLDYAACILGASAHLLLDGYSLLFA
ncbi:MAG: ROK family transcriptional regulator [Chloroflexota bacterium]